MPISAASSEHLGPDDVTAFVTAGPRGARGGDIVAHLARCEDCRYEVREVSRLVRPHPARHARFVALAAAAAGVVLAAWLGLRSAKPEVDQERTSTRTTTPGVVSLVGPLGPVTRGASPDFTWHAARGAVEYRLTLLDAGGVVIWSTMTVDTVATLPVETSLVSGPAYYWFVDVLLADGSSATSGAREFRVTR